MTIKARFLFNLLAFFALCFISSNAWATKSNEKDRNLTYHFYSGGIHFITAQLAIEQNNQNYHALFAATPHGFLGRILPWSAQIKVNGQIKDGALHPQEFVNLTAWRDVPKTATLKYDADGRLTHFIENTPKHGIREKPVQQAHAEDTVDVLTAVLQTMNAPIAQACKQSFPVFDGKRRFDITISKPKMVKLEKSRYNAFSGDAIECILDVEPIAGFKNKKSGWQSLEADGKKSNDAPKVWFGLNEETNTVELIKIRLNTDYGVVFAHLAPSQEP